jgi:hypothetical protein
MSVESSEIYAQFEMDMGDEYLADIYRILDELALLTK